MVYKPNDNDGEFLTDEKGRHIKVTPGLYFQDADPMLSLQNGPTISGITMHFMYAACRLGQPTPVEGVQWTERKFSGKSSLFSGKTSSDKVTLPRGALLLRSVEPDAAGKHQWYGLTMSQANGSFQNLQREQFVPEKGAVYQDASPRPPNVGTIDNASERAINALNAIFTDAQQRDAHIADVKFVDKVKIEILAESLAYKAPKASAPVAGR